MRLALLPFHNIGTVKLNMNYAYRYIKKRYINFRLIIQGTGKEQFHPWAFTRTIFPELILKKWTQ